MRLLMLGGTIFVGRHIVESALARGHEVTLFNRGQHNPELFPGIERIHGDRDGGLQALLEGGNKTWDAVVDTCGYFPRVVRQSAQALAGIAAHYTFISSISVYAGFEAPGMREDSPLGVIGSAEAEAADKITLENYGPLKVRCEQEVMDAFPESNLLIRPGLIVGPYDISDRFTYWPVRASRGGRMLVPGHASQRMELIDVRDLAEWTVRVIESGGTGAYNASGPDYPLTMGSLLDSCRRLTGSNAEPAFVDGDFLTEQGLDPGSLNTWYVSPSEPEWQFIWDVDCSKARRDGLTYRPLDVTIQDTLAWDASRPADVPRRVDLDPACEAAILAAWDKRDAS